jgi:(1->4)-alpha-D-glucan 1-alpha-D-glucosylmutase
MGALNSLSQLTLKATMPGVPDFYQGTELWDLSLVDPDNRRPVDFAARRESLGEPDWPALMASWHDGRIKLTLTQRLLLLRQYHPALFQDGDYQPVEVTGKDSDRVVAFTRRADRTRLLVAIVRHFAPATDNGERWPRADWNAELKLDRRDFGTWRDALGSGSPCSSDLSLSHLLATLPIAVLVSG